MDQICAEREVVADFFADNLLTNEAAIRAVCEYQPTTARGIRDYIKKLLDKLGGKNNTLEKAVAMYNKALKDVAAKAQANAENRLKLPKTQQGRAQESGLKLGGTKTQYSAEEKQKGAYSKKEIAAIQNITRKSINSLSSKELQSVDAFAKQYWNQMGTKSPFFRAWFGDWRANDTRTPVQTATKRGNNRGLQQNKDTRWNINVSRQVFNETSAHQLPYNVQARQYLPYINDIIEKAILMDSFTEGGDAKSVNSLLMHSLYSVADIGNGPELLKLYVEEMNDPNTTDTTKRAYQLQNIERQQSSVTGSGNALAVSTSTADIRTVADLYSAVKAHDPSFKPNPVSKIVDEDGEPLVVYHGTDQDFTVFDPTKGRSTMDIMGMFFSPWEIDAGGYGPNVRSYYLSIKKPASEGTAYRALNRFKGQNDAGKKARDFLISQGYDGVNNGNEEYIAFYPEQIKSATDNVGTFDRNNPDVRYSVDLDEDTYNRRVLVSEDTVDKWLKDYASKSTPKYAQAYITRMSPERFLDLTTSRMGRLTIDNQTEKLDLDNLIKATQDQPLQMQISDGEVVGHEGRHRANALERAGINSIPVLVFDYSNKYSKEVTPEMDVRGQVFGSSRSYDNVTLHDLTPLNYENRDKIIQDYGTKNATERMQEQYGGKKTVQFSVDADDEYRETPDTPALEKLGVKLASSKGRYDLSEQLLERDKAAKELMRATKKAEKKLNATKAEKEFAAGIAAGIYEERDIPKSMNKDKVTTLAQRLACNWKGLALFFWR